MNTTYIMPDGLSSVRHSPQLSESQLERLKQMAIRSAQVGFKMAENSQKGPSRGSNRTKTVHNTFFDSDFFMSGLESHHQDAILGVIRSFRADYEGTHRGEEVDYSKIIKIITHIETITSLAIENYLRMSSRQARKYVVVLEAIMQLVDFNN